MQFAMNIRGHWNEMVRGTQRAETAHVAHTIMVQ